MFCTTLVFLAAALQAVGAEPEIAGKIVSAGLFKNGVASITREYTVPGPGSYTFEALGNPVHGTLWIDGDGPVVARSGSEPVDAAPEESASAGVAETLVGRRVEIGLRLEDSTPFTGTLLAAPGGGAYESRNVEMVRDRIVAPASDMFVLDIDGNPSYIARDLVAYVRALEPAAAVKRTKSVLVFDVGEGAPNPCTIRARYLTRGLSWAPSYRIDLTDGGTLSIGQSAVIRNELEDLDGVAMELISGFPNVEYLQAVSPFAANANWADFMSQLARRAGGFDPSAVQMAATSNISPLFTNEADVMGELSTIPYTPDDGADLYYHPAGAHTLGKGESLLLTLATASADYERIVEWRVNRSAGQGDAAGPRQDDLWDALRFRNPFPFPMTTGPAMVESKGRFLGSKTVFWAAPGSETVAYVSKALSLRAGYVEEEVSRTEVRELNRPVFATVVKGTLTMQNPRTDAVNLVIHEDILGAVLRADGDPITAVGPAGPGRRNPSTKLTWKLTLEPGEAREVTLEYRYLVD
jgi:hypothetical protein